MLKVLLKADFIISVITFVGSLYLFFVTQTFGSLAVYSKLGPAFWPQLILITLMALSIAIAVNTIRTALKGGTPKTSKIKFSADNLRFVAATALIATYIGLLPVIGFMTLTPIMMIVFMVLLGERSKAWILTIPFVLTLGIILVFTKIMYVPLPRGIGIFLNISHLLY